MTNDNFFLIEIENPQWDLTTPSINANVGIFTTQWSLGLVTLSLATFELWCDDLKMMVVLI